jgi:hypothetical protein
VVRIAIALERHLKRCVKALRERGNEPLLTIEQEAFMGDFGKIGQDGTGRNLNPQETRIPDALDDARHKSQIAFWDIQKDSELAKRQTYPGLGDRDLLPRVGMVFPPEPVARPGGYQPPPQPHNFFAIAKRADGLPLEAIEYTPDGKGGFSYRQQYLFQYDKLASGQNRVTVQNWAPSDKVLAAGPRLSIGDHQNTMVGVTQYYQDGSNTKHMEYWTGASVLQLQQQREEDAAKAKSGVKDKPRLDPAGADLQIDFQPDASRVVIRKKSPSGLISDGMVGGQNDVYSAIRKCNFYDLFGPKSQ